MSNPLYISLTPLYYLLNNLFKKLYLTNGKENQINKPQQM